MAAGTSPAARSSARDLLGPRFGARGLEEGERVVKSGTSVRSAARPSCGACRGRAASSHARSRMSAPCRSSAGLELVLVVGLVGEQPATVGPPSPRASAARSSAAWRSSTASTALGFRERRRHRMHASMWSAGAMVDVSGDGSRNRSSRRWHSLRWSDRAIERDQPDSSSSPRAAAAKTSIEVAPVRRGVVERCGGVGPAVLLVAEDRLDACQHDQRE